MLIIQASNIHEGGGRILLLDFMKQLALKFRLKSSPPKDKIQVYIDSRFNIDVVLDQDSLKYFQINVVAASSAFARFLAEIKIFLKTRTFPGDSKILCFGNLPPLFPVKAEVIMYFHTVLYFKEFTHLKLNLKLRIKLYVETLWVRVGLKNVDTIFVQSDFMKTTFDKNFRFKNIRIFPFLPEFFFSEKNDKMQAINSRKNDFFYPAIGSQHKNHLNLIQAWKLLAQENIFPQLILTVDEFFTEIMNEIKDANIIHGAKISNRPAQTYAEICGLYQDSKALIFPSYCESFGIPLIEAQKYQLHILASELDYVRDQVTPIETFDPSSPRSIARAVKRYLKIEDKKNSARNVSDFAEEFCK